LAGGGSRTTQTSKMFTKNFGGSKFDPPPPAEDVERWLKIQAVVGNAEAEADVIKIRTVVKSTFRQIKKSTS